MTRNRIDEKYLSQANNLEAEFFNIIDLGKPSQHRILKGGKTIKDFNRRHGKIWCNHEAELIAAGFIEIPTPPEPARDLITEIDELKAKVTKLETEIERSGIIKL